MQLLRLSSIQLSLALLAGMLIAYALLGMRPTVGRVLLENEFRRAYIDCALSELHATQFKSVTMSTSLRAGVDRTLEVEALRCFDYSDLKLRLKSYAVSDTQIALI